jgi:hypothetical protein
MKYLILLFSLFGFNTFAIDQSTYDSELQQYIHEFIEYSDNKVTQKDIDKVPITF